MTQVATLSQSVSRDKIIKHWNALTADNHHGQAGEYLARMTGLTHMAKKLALINQLCDLEGHLPEGLNHYRGQIISSVFDHVRTQWGDTQYARLK